MYHHPKEETGLRGGLWCLLGSIRWKEVESQNLLQDLILTFASSQMDIVIK